MAFDPVDWLLENAEEIIDVGFTVADYVNKDDAQSTLAGSSTSNMVAPFDPNKRDEMGERYMALQRDPSYISQLPGYKFGLDELTKMTNRESAKTGHYLGNRRIGLLQDRTQQYASRAYQQEVDNLGAGAGIGMRPDASTYGDLTKTAVGGDIGQMSTLKSGSDDLFDIGKKLLSNFKSAGGDELLAGLSDSLGIDFGAWGDDAKAWMSDTFDIDLGGMGDSFSATMEEYGLDDVDWGGAAMRLARGDDPKEVLKDTAIDYVKKQGKDYVKDGLKDLYADWTTSSNEAAAEAGNLASGLPDSGGLQQPGGPGGGPGINQNLYDGYGDFMTASGTASNASAASAGNLAAGLPDAGGLQLPGGPGGGPGVASSSAAGTGAMNPGMLSTGAAASGGAMLGAVAADYIGDKYIDKHLGDFGESPINDYGKTVGGSIGGAAAAGAANAVLAGGSAGAGAVSSMAYVAGPVAIAAMIYLIGSKAYGMYKSSQAKNTARGEQRLAAGEAYSQNAQIADPTGMGLGMGSMYEEGGNSFFLPDKHYTSLKSKNTTGHYANDLNVSGVQGSYGYWQGGENDWQLGRFGDDMTSGTFALEGGEGWYGDTMSELEKQKTGRLDTWLTAHGRADETSGYSGPAMTDAMRAQAMYAPGGVYGGAKQQGVVPSNIGNRSGDADGTGDYSEQALTGQWTSAGEGTKSTWSAYDPDGGGQSCFIKGTLVRMADGTTRAIEDVRVGELVKSLDGNAVVEGHERVVLAGRRIYGFMDQDTSWFTHEHPFLTERGWMAVDGSQTENVPAGYVGDFQMTDILLTESGPRKMHGLIERHGPEQDMFNLMLEDAHEVYYAGPSEDLLFAVMD